MAKLKDAMTISPTISEEESFDDSAYKSVGEIPDQFVFDEKKHVYTLNGIRMYGVTSVLGVIAKPALIQWAANQVVEWIQNNAPKELVKGAYLFGLTNKMLDEAKVAHRKKKESAGDIGKAVHLSVEEWIKEKKEPTLDAQGMVMFEHFRKWAEDNKIAFLSSEQKIYSKTHWVAGTVDAVVIKGDKKYVMDIKTYSGIYDRTPFLQMAGYAIMLEEMGHKDIAGSIVVRLGKDGTFETLENTNLEEEKVGFLAALTLFKTLEAYKK